MGKGDMKTKRGKIARGTYGARRKKPSVPAIVVSAKKEKPAKVAKAAEAPTAKKSAAKKAPAKKPVSKKATAAE